MKFGFYPDQYRFAPGGRGFFFSEVMGSVRYDEESVRYDEESVRYDEGSGFIFLVSYY